MPISVYKLIYKDEDCTKLAPSNKVAVKTYTTERSRLVGSCKLFVTSPRYKMFTRSNHSTVASHEGSVIISCATSID